jgi:hypothetical protein
MEGRVRTHTSDTTLIDVVRESPIDETLLRTRRRRFLIALAIVIVLVAALFLWARVAASQVRGPRSAAASKVDRS